MKNITMILMIISNFVVPILLCELLNIRDSLCSIIYLLIFLIHLIPTYKLFIKLF
jgi:hypothetical protein